mmetsp:Transcript_49915/g.132662  ORF Transcript_49915/g.132662 Transcript_49915/m.132662 type:complete len:203 (-) Transcript_49915:1086-1694(-)
MQSQPSSYLLRAAHLSYTTRRTQSGLRLKFLLLVVCSQNVRPALLPVVRHLTAMSVPSLALKDEAIPRQALYQEERRPPNNIEQRQQHRRVTRAARMRKAICSSFSKTLMDRRHSSKRKLRQRPAVNRARQIKRTICLTRSTKGLKGKRNRQPRILWSLQRWQRLQRKGQGWRPVEEASKGEPTSPDRQQIPRCLRHRCPTT